MTDREYAKLIFERGEMLSYYGTICHSLEEFDEAEKQHASSDDYPASGHRIAPQFIRDDSKLEVKIDGEWIISETDNKLVKWLKNS